MRFSPRPVLAAVAATCVALVAFAILFLQERLGLEPCPMCVLQRYAFGAVAIVAAIGAIHGPGRTGRIAYGSLITLFAAAGAGVAIRHAYLQRNPPVTSSCMGSDLEFFVSNFPLSQALPKIFAGTGDCSKVDWKALGLTIPEWALVWFVLFAAVGLWLALRSREAAR